MVFSVSPNRFSSETLEIAREDACAPQTLAQTASAENYCDPQNLYLPMLLEIFFPEML